MVNLNCPNCGRIIGEASRKDNYKEKYYNYNDKNEPVCITYGTGKDNIFVNVLFIIFITMLVILFAGIFILN